MLIYWDRLRHFQKGPAPDGPIDFGMRRFRAALDAAGIRSCVLRRDEFTGDESVRALVLTFAGFRAESTLPPESYQIRRRGQVVYLNASDRTGAMYGLLELAEIHRLRWVWVKGHADDELNARCDALAVAESRKYL